MQGHIPEEDALAIYIRPIIYQYLRNLCIICDMKRGSAAIVLGVDIRSVIDE